MNKVSAAVVSGCIDSGTSLVGAGKLGSQQIGSNYVYNFDNGATDVSVLDLSFCTDVPNESANQSGYEYVHFAVTYCTNAPKPWSGLSYITSRYHNFIDLSVDINSRIYLGEEEWMGADCYTSYVRLRMSYSDNIGNSNLNYRTYTDTNNSFNIYNDYGYGGILRYTDLIFYNSNDYEKALNQAKELKKQQEIIDVQNETNNKLNQQMQQDKNQHDEFMNSDISDSDKELPDDSKYQDYTDTENDLKDKVNQADMNVISIGIDSNSSNFIWDTLTRLIQSNSIVFGMFIAILSIGIIKLALGR